MKQLGIRFFRQPSVDLAPALIGTVLVRRIGTRTLRSRIVETEAYLGPHDLAAHSSKGRTKRTEVMFGPAGHAYVYLIYGMHQMLNIVAGETGSAQAVLIRAAEPLDGWVADLSGPGKLARAMQIERLHNGLDLTSPEAPLLVLGPSTRVPRIVRSPRIGVDYAGAWKDELLRFFDADSAAVSAGGARRAARQGFS